MKPIGNILQRFPLLRIAILLILGIFVGDSFGHLLPLHTGLVVVGSVLVVYFLSTALFRRKHTGVLRFTALFHSILLQIACFAFGFYLISMDKHALSHTFPTRKGTFDAVLASEPTVRGKVVQCELLVVNPNKKPFRLRASILRDTVWNRYQRLHVGDGIHARASIESIEKIAPMTAQSTNFDFRRWLQVREIVGQTFIHYSDWQKSVVSLRTVSVVERAKIRLLRFRQKAIGALQESGLEGQEQAIVAAMALGDKSALTKELRETYSVSGASHVLALSGMHLGIIYFLLSFIFVRMGWHVAGQMITLPVIWLFVLMVGLSPSVVRAATMLTVYGFVALLRRKSSSLNTLALAAVIMLFSRPMALWDVGFQLSFMAVLGIIVFHSPFHHGLQTLLNQMVGKKIRRKPVFSTTANLILTIVAMSLATQMMTAPLVAYYFGRFPTYFLATNLIAVPLVTLILYTAAAFFLAVATESLFGLALPMVRDWLAQLLGILSRLLNSGIETIASWPGSSIEDIHINGIQTLLLYLLTATLTAFFVLLWRKIKEKAKIILQKFFW